MSVRIVTDSTCDLPVDVIEQYGITVVPIYVNLENKSYQDGVNLDRQGFYQQLESSKTFPSTASPSTESFVTVFSDLAKKGADAILSIHLASTISGVYNVAMLASQSVKQGLVRTIDAGQISLGTGFIVAAAAKMAKAGKSLSEIIAAIQELANRTYTFAIVDNLKYLQHSGRVSQFKALLGSLLQVKPLLRFYQGIPTVKILRTSKSAVEQLLASVKSLGKLEALNVLHINALDKALALQETALNQFPELANSKIIDVSPAIGTHIGPGTVGFAAVAAAPEK
jgi:DegV family protein with EDD domain